MLCVLISLLYQNYKAYCLCRNVKYNRVCGLLYYFIIFMACSFYPVSNYYYKKEQYGLSTFYHSLVHVFGNIANVVLYSG